MYQLVYRENIIMIVLWSLLSGLCKDLLLHLIIYLQIHKRYCTNVLQCSKLMKMAVWQQNPHIKKKLAQSKYKMFNNSIFHDFIVQVHVYIYLINKSIDPKLSYITTSIFELTGHHLVADLLPIQHWMPAMLSIILTHQHHNSQHSLLFG